MTDEQLIAGAIVTVGGGLAGAFKWAVSRITASTDRNSDAMLANTASNAVLSTKIDQIALFVERHTPIQGVPITPIAQESTQPIAAPSAMPSRRTPPQGTQADGGYAMHFPRPITRPGDR